MSDFEFLHKTSQLNTDHYKYKKKKINLALKEKGKRWNHDYDSPPSSLSTIAGAAGTAADTPGHYVLMSDHIYCHWSGVVEGGGRLEERVRPLRELKGRSIFCGPVAVNT